MVLALSLLLVMVCGTNSALARSGGVMGGHSFRSSSSKSRSSRSKSLSKTDGDDVDEHVTVRLCLYLFAWIFTPLHLYVNLPLINTSIIKLQVGLLVKGGSLQNNLNRIAKTTDTSKKCGWRDILRGTINCLSRHSSRWISGYSHKDLLFDSDDPEGRFKQLSDKERRKFDEETLVNLNNREKETITSQEVKDQPKNTYMVTVLVAAKGWYKVPTITGRGAIEKILLELKYICRLHDRIQGLVVLWTPQRKDEVLLLEDLQRDYPLLKPFNA
ncbi:Myelin-associated oligodendrocyte basic protein [Melia azedarach]|uniref:Myelin-associated oligodendrocyte basic protein n=1 Tax=Melia azedarach TaxID=155640 RepID=A0ACC1YXF2_MELAZ|nr:Myelin-associated oligodendrocyte basic protein [Melia azedarach]